MNLSQGPEPEFIKGLFGSIANGYDLANDLMTFGLARAWRRKLVRWSEAKAGQKILDCATGTGDLAFEFKRAVGPQGSVIGSDFCPEMLARAPVKSRELNLPVEFVVQDATQLPYANHSFDIASIAFGLRNINEPQKALQEMARVTRPEGWVMILETGDGRIPILSTLIQFYFFFIVPLIGGWVTGKKSAYQYLSQSSQSFPGNKRFLKLMQDTAAFSHCECCSLLGGAAYLYRGKVRNRE